VTKTKTYVLGPGTRLINRVFRVMTRLGIAASYRHTLTVPGRKTGRPYSTPVDVMEVAALGGWWRATARPTGSGTPRPRGR
jgi:hypothetical protein